MKRLTLFILSLVMGFALNAQQLNKADVEKISAVVKQNIVTDQEFDYTKIKRCGTDDLHHDLMSDPEYAKNYHQLLNDNMKALENMEKGAACPNGPVVIPVAVHFEAGIGTTPAEQACLLDLVNTQIMVLNDDFNGLNDPGCSSTNAGGACITFVLATQNHPGGSGLAAGDPAVTFNGAYTCPPTSPCNIAAWNGLLNIVVQGGTGVLGIAPLNGHPFGTNTVVIEACAFGTIDVSCDQAGPNMIGPSPGCAPSTGGATTTHEIGHYLGLPHVFCTDQGGAPQGTTSCAGTGCAGAATDCDGIPDTYPTCISTYGCPSGGCNGTTTSPCDGNNYVWSNFMDYVNDACMNTFSDGQTTIMNNNADSDPFDLSTITNTVPDCDVVLVYQGVIIPDGGSIDLCDGATIQVYDASSGIYASDNPPAAPTWTYVVNDGGGITANINDPNIQNPGITITGAGPLVGGTLTVDLTVGNVHGDCAPNATATITVNILDPSDPSCQCALAVTPDYANVTCQDFGGTLLPTIPINVAGGTGTVWIDQDGNTTFDAAADIDITGGGNIGFPTSDLTITVYDSGNGACNLTITVDSGNYSCEGTTAGDPAVRVCTVSGVADAANFNCVDATTVEIPITLDDVAGNVVFTPSIVTGTGTAGDPYLATVSIGAGCTPVNLTVSDDGAQTLTPVFTVNGPGSVAGTYPVGGEPAFGPGFPATPVTGNVVLADDGVGVVTDMCDPPPVNCAAMAGNIVLIDRGSCNFTDKVIAAQNCGAIAVIICNNDVANPDQVITMAGTDPAITIPSVFISYNSCLDIIAEINNGLNVTIVEESLSAAPCETVINIDPCAIDCGTACPATVNVQATDAFDACGTTGTINLPIDLTTLQAAGLDLDDDSDAVFSWSTGNYLSAGGAAIADPANVPALTTVDCNNVSETYYLNVDCGSTPLATTLDGGSFVYTVYPDLSTVGFAIVGDGTCGPTVNVPQGCGGMTVTNDLDGNGATPDYTAQAGNSGNVNFTVVNPGAPAGVGATCETLALPATFDCLVACPTITVTDGSDAVCSGALGTEVNDWQTAVGAVNPTTDPDGTSTGLVYSSVMDGMAGFPDGILPSGVSAETCDNIDQVVYAYLGCDTSGDGAADSYQLVGTYTLTVYAAPQAPLNIGVLAGAAQCDYTVQFACPGDVEGAATSVDGSVEVPGYAGNPTESVEVQTMNGCTATFQLPKPLCEACTAQSATFCPE